MKIENIKCFLAVVRTGSLHKAAGELYLTPQNLSTIIRNIENDTGEELFIRTSKGMQLSAEGEKFLPYAIIIENAYNEYMDSKKQESNILNLYTTPMLSGELANLQGILLSERYYLSVQNRGVKDLIDMLQKNLSGIYLLAIRSEKLQELNLREYTTIQQFSETYTVCHKSNPITPATYQRKNHMVIMHDYYEGNYGDYLRMSDLEQIKTLLREKRAVFNCTDFYYHKYFKDESEWVVLQKKEIPLFDIVLIINDSFDQSISKEVKKQIHKCFSSISCGLD